VRRDSSRQQVTRSPGIWRIKIAGSADEGEDLPREYVVGWIERGALGVIGTDEKNATDTVHASPRT
jgi:hypothetical protein